MTTMFQVIVGRKQEAYSEHRTLQTALKVAKRDSKKYKQPHRVRQVERRKERGETVEKVVKYYPLSLAG